MSKLINDLRSQENFNFVSWIIKFWEKKTTITIVLFALAAIGISIAWKINLLDITKNISLLECLLIGTVLLGVFLFWLYTQTPPKISKNKIGIVIAIVCEDKKERQRLKTEFITVLKETIAKGNSQHFEILDLSEYHANKINSTGNLRKYHRVTRGHLVIYGNCRIRNHMGLENYVINLNASVMHAPIPDEVSKELGQEMRNLIPTQQFIPVSDEVNGFSVTRESIGIATRYIVGLASLVSGDMETSFDLHLGLWNELKQMFEDNQKITDAHIFLKTKLPTRLITEGLPLASWAYTSKENGYLEKMNKFLTTVQEVDPRNYAAHLLRGIYYFLTGNIAKAKEEIRKSRNDRDVAWQFSEAFLSAYDGDLELAHKIYQRAFHGSIIRVSIPLEVETFIKDVFEKEPSKIQLSYCLGMINYFSKGDLNLGKQDFQIFIEQAEKSGQFKKSIEFAKKYISEIVDKLNKK